MTLSKKLILAQAPLALALLGISLFALHTNHRLSQTSKAILKDNFRSVLAIQRIQDAVERLDEAAVGRVLGRPSIASLEEGELARQVEGELVVQEGNVTEPGEDEATRRLRVSWTQYQLAFAGVTAQPLGDLYHQRLSPQRQALRAAANEILALNLDAIVAKNDRVHKSADDSDAVMFFATLGACLLGLVASGSLTSRLLRPLGVLSQAVRRIAEGDLGARINLEGQDEISGLAREFNTMTERLETYRRSSLGELLEAQQSSQAAIDSLTDPVVVFDAQGGVVNVNSASEKLLGLSVEQGTATLAESAPLRAGLARVSGHILAGKGSYAPKGFEEALSTTTPEGERFLLPRGSPIYSAEGAIRGATVVLQDVTKLRVFDDLTHDLVATVAHEFRTPLTSLRMAIHLCVEEVTGPLSPKQAELLYAAREDCERLQRMVNDLLDVARLQSGRMSFSRKKVAADSLTPMVEAYDKEARAQGVELHAEPTPQGLFVEVDPTRLQLVFANLLNNALHFTPRGGHIDVRVLPTKDGFLRFEISDTGPGIPTEYHERIFDKFFQVPGVAHSGAGLGLHIAREVVRAHGGELGVDSKVAHGSTFWFTLPLVGN